jgi:uncharacterized protein (DUF488 family)
MRHRGGKAAAARQAGNVTPSPSDDDSATGGPPRRLVTVGHGTLGAEELTRLLREAGITSLVDVRTAPGSRRSPHLHRLELTKWLPETGVDYRWEPSLGGFRKPGPGSPNTRLRNSSFRGYADYMDAPEFWQALDAVLLEAEERAVTVMCSEAVWWRCHRRLIADAAVLARHVAVEHLMHDGRLVPHRLTESVRLTDDGRLRYDGGQEELSRPEAGTD